MTGLHNNRMHLTGPSANGLQAPQVIRVLDGHQGNEQSSVMKPKIEAEVDDKGNIRPKEPVAFPDFQVAPKISTISFGYEIEIAVEGFCTTKESQALIERCTAQNPLVR